MKSTNNFNRLAFIYDQLAYLVFGRSIKKAQTHFLKDVIKSDQRVLILGGGTGWILTELDKLGAPLEVTYIDSSIKMIERSKGRKPFKFIDVEFVHGDQSSIPDQYYDLIITNFFLDLFDKEHLPKVMTTIDDCLLDSGHWLCTDFRHAGWWQNLLVKSMYLFFRFTAKLEGDRLQVFSQHFASLGYLPYEAKRFHHQMIETAVYRRIK